MITFNRTQAAAFLNMHPVTLLEKVHAGIIPAAKPAKSWVFIQQDLLDYLRGLYLTKNSHQVTTENKSYCNENNNFNLVTSKPLSANNKGLGVKNAYFQLLKIADCQQIHSPKPAPCSGARHADGTEQVAGVFCEAVELVVNSVNVTQSNTRMM